MNAKVLATTLLVALAASSSAQAGVLFYNTGSANGWSANNINNNCSVTTTSVIALEGTTSMRSECIFNGNYNGRYHAMKIRNPFGGNGSTRWIGFGFYLSSNHTFAAESTWLMQTIAKYGASFTPNIWLKINDRKLTLTRQFGPLSSRTKSEVDVLTNLQKGRWYEVVMKVHMDDDASGKIEVWIDGTKEVTMNGPNYFDGRTETLRIDLGLYCTGWYQKDTLPVPAAGTRLVFFDEFRLGDANSSFAEVDPGQGGGDADLISAATYSAKSGGWTNHGRVHDGSTTAAGNSTADPAWIEYDFGTNRTIKTARINEDDAGNWHVGQWKIKYWNGSSFVDAFSYTNSTNAGWNSVNFTDRVTSKIRLYLKPPAGGRVEIREFECVGQ